MRQCGQWRFSREPSTQTTSSAGSSRTSRPPNASPTSGVGSTIWARADSSGRAACTGPPDTRPDTSTFLAAVHPDDRADYLDAHRAALAGVRPYSIDHRVVWPDGTVRHVQQEAEVVRDAAGAPVRVVGIVEDRTERVHTEARLADIERRRRELLHRMMRTMDEERARLAGALHDEPIQQLTIASLRLEHAAMTSDQPVPVPVDDLVARIHDMIDRLRSSLIQLDPLSTRIAGLRVALEHLARSTLGELVSVSIVDELGAEPPEAVTRTVVRIAQEALANIRDHAAANRVELHVSGDADLTELRVRDYLGGFYVDRHGAETHQLGLVGMEERAAAMGGTVTFASDSSGTTVTVRLPHP